MTQRNYLLIFCMGFILQVNPMQTLFFSPSNTFAANNWSQQDELTASTRSQFDDFGYSTTLSADGNVAIAGSIGFSSGQGAVYLFTRQGTTWSPQGGAVTVAGGAANDKFGCSVSLSADGGTVIVGARGKNSGQGAAYVFTRSGSALTDQVELTRSDVAAMDDFGVSVALSGDGNTAIVGAEGKNSAYIFIRSGSVWSQQGSPLTPSGASTGYQFGFSVSLSADGNTALVGAPGKESGKGAAYIYTRSGATWSFKSELAPSAVLATDDSFGYSVAISADGNTALIGAVNRNAGQGNAYVFVRSADDWVQEGDALASHSGSAGDNFGLSVSLSGDGNTALIGAVGRSSITGSSYIFTRTSSIWNEQAELTANNGVENDNFAFSTALSSDSSTAAFGAIGTDTFSGSLYIFVQPLKPTVTTVDPITNITPTSATGGGNVTSDGGAAINSRGVCWSPSPDPTTSDSCTSDGSGTGVFTSYISNLLQATTYHVRAFATNIAGTAYGSDVSFSTNAILNVTLAGTGTGTGTVHSNSPDINCSSGTCSRSYPYGTPVTLSAVPGLRSVFPGWQGSCSNPSGDCNVTMDSGRSVLATFNVDPAFAVWIDPGTNYYNKISTAYQSSGSTAYIKSCNIEIIDDLSFDQKKTIRLSGGYKADFLTRSGYTVIEGKMTISSGVVTVENLVIR
jgi:hypothetical protein